MAKIFEKIAPYYNALMRNVDYKQWGEYLMRVLNYYHFVPKKMLDVACGTGNSTFPFWEEFPEKVFGADISIEMLKEAKKKFPFLPFVNADIRKLPFSQTFNLTTCIFDSLNYMLTEDDLFKAFSSVREILIKGGLFIFDMNTEYGLKTINSLGTLNKDNQDVISIWRHYYKEEKKELTLHLSIFPKFENTRERIDEVHTERAYSISTIKSFLNKAYFVLLNTYTCFSFAHPNPKTKRILFVAKAI